jgi:hypothetical protein
MVFESTKKGIQIMRLLGKALAPLAVGAFLLMTGGNAFADVFGTAQVFVTKDVLILETIIIAKDVFIDADVIIEPEKAAESLAVINQTNFDNEACENCAEKMDSIIDSVTGNDGITTVNQAGGNMNNQGMALAVAIDKEDPTDPDAPDGFAEAQVAVDQENFSNLVESIQIIFRDALISNSINTNTGITGVNQATGNINNQANAVSIAVSLSGGVALSEGLLGQETSGNENLEFDIFKTATISGSISGNTGVTQVNQSAGNLGNQANLVSVAATIGGL